MNSVKLDIMKILYTLEQLELVDTVKSLAENKIAKFCTEQYYNVVSKELIGTSADFGLLGMSIPSEYSGLEFPLDTIALILEEIAKVDISPAIILSVHSMVASLITKFGSKAQKEKYLPALASGEILAAFALTEPSAGSDASAIKTKAVKNKDGFNISGEKCYITGAGFADLYLVFAVTDAKQGKNGISAFLIEDKTPGMTFGLPEKKMGADYSPIASISFNECQLKKEQLLGDLHSGLQVALGGLASGRINIAACANGLSHTAIQTAINYMKERKQFSEPLANFQGLQFMLADMKIKLEAARLLTWHAAKAYVNNPDARQNRLNSSIAKCNATDSAMQITTDAVQLLGGAGYLKDYKVEKYMRDAKMLQIVEGTNQIQRMVIAKELFS